MDDEFSKIICGEFLDDGNAHKKNGGRRDASVGRAADFQIRRPVQLSPSGDRPQFTKKKGEKDNKI